MGQLLVLTIITGSSLYYAAGDAELQAGKETAHGAFLLVNSRSQSDTLPSSLQPDTYPAAVAPLGLAPMSTTLPSVAAEAARRNVERCAGLCDKIAKIRAREKELVAHNTEMAKWDAVNRVNGLVRTLVTEVTANMTSAGSHYMGNLSRTFNNYLTSERDNIKNETFNQGALTLMMQRANFTQQLHEDTGIVDSYGTQMTSAGLAEAQRTISKENQQMAARIGQAASHLVDVFGNAAQQWHATENASSSSAQAALAYWSSAYNDLTFEYGNITSSLNSATRAGVLSSTSGKEARWDEQAMRIAADIAEVADQKAKTSMGQVQLAQQQAQKVASLEQAQRAWVTDLEDLVGRAERSAKQAQRDAGFNGPE